MVKQGEREMTNQEILRIAMEQSARDESCRPDDCLREEHVVVPSKVSSGARNYLEPACAQWGFRPAWIEMTAKPISFVKQMNGIKARREEL